MCDNSLCHIEYYLLQNQSTNEEYVQYRYNLSALKLQTTNIQNYGRIATGDVHPKVDQDLFDLSY